MRKQRIKLRTLLGHPGVIPLLVAGGITALVSGFRILFSAKLRGIRRKSPELRPLFIFRHSD